MNLLPSRREKPAGTTFYPDHTFNGLLISDPAVWVEFITDIPELMRACVYCDVIAMLLNGMSLTLVS